MPVINATNDTIHNHTKEGLVLLDFYAPWCNPCKMLNPILDQLSEEYTVVKVDGDVEEELRDSFEVMAYPTLFVLKDGVTLKRISGFKPKEALSELLEKYK